MKTIYKYPITMSESFVIKTVRILKPVYVAKQDGKPFVWCVVDNTTHSNFHYEFSVVGTGEHIPENSEYVGTFQQDGYVWHLFQIIPF